MEDGKGTRRDEEGRGGTRRADVQSEAEVLDDSTEDQIDEEV
jgi:hypothetical protein